MSAPEYPGRFEPITLPTGLRAALAALALLSAPALAAESKDVLRVGPQHETSTGLAAQSGVTTLIGRVARMSIMRGRQAGSCTRTIDRA